MELFIARAEIAQQRVDFSRAMHFDKVRRAEVVLRQKIEYLLPNIARENKNIKHTCKLSGTLRKDEEYGD